jgi:hypothetical protein
VPENEIYAEASDVRVDGVLGRQLAFGGRPKLSVGLELAPDREMERASVPRQDAKPDVGTRVIGLTLLRLGRHAAGERPLLHLN